MKPLTVYEYSEQALNTRLPTSESLAYAFPAMVDEVGEIAKVFKKAQRDDGWVFGQLLPEHRRKQLREECGDLIWELNNLICMAGLSMEDVMEYNLIKLADRKRRKVLGGDGDYR